MVSAGFEEDVRLTFQERSDKVIAVAYAGGESCSEVALTWRYAMQRDEKDEHQIGGN